MNGFFTDVRAQVSRTAAQQSPLPALYCKPPTRVPEDPAFSWMLVQCLAPRRACEAAPEGESTLGVLFEVTVSKILIVEDNEMNRDMLSRRLLRKGYEVIMAEDGESGVVMAQSDRPDVILMDMSLPVIDGWEATRRIKASADLRAIPVIALTAHAMGSDRDKAIEAGCDDYDTKPIELPRLLEKIERLLAGRKQQ